MEGRGDAALLDGSGGCARGWHRLPFGGPERPDTTVDEQENTGELSKDTVQVQ